MNRRTLFGSGLAAVIGSIFGVKNSRAQILENIKSTARVIDLGVDYVPGTTTKWYSRPLTEEESRQMDIFDKIVSVFPTEKSYDESLLSKINLIEVSEDYAEIPLYTTQENHTHFIQIPLYGNDGKIPLSFDKIENDISHTIESAIYSYWSNEEYIEKYGQFMSRDSNLFGWMKKNCHLVFHPSTKQVGCCCTYGDGASH